MFWSFQNEICRWKITWPILHFVQKSISRLIKIIRSGYKLFLSAVFFILMMPLYQSIMRRCTAISLQSQVHLVQPIPRDTKNSCFCIGSRDGNRSDIQACYLFVQPVCCSLLFVVPEHGWFGWRIVLLHLFVPVKPQFSNTISICFPRESGVLKVKRCYNFLQAIHKSAPVARTPEGIVNNGTKGETNIYPAILQSSSV